MKYKEKTYKILAGVLTFLSSPLITSADVLPDSEQGYAPLESIPGLTDKISTSTPINLAEFLNSGFSFLVGISVVIAVVMITIGGFQYLTSAASGSKEDAKSKIQNSVKGLLLILLTYIILYTINPDTVSLEFLTGVRDTSKIDQAAPQGTTRYYFDYHENEVGSEDEKIRDILATKIACDTQVELISSAIVPTYEPIGACQDDTHEAPEKIYTYGYTSHNKPAVETLFPSERTRVFPESKTEEFLTEPLCEASREAFENTKSTVIPYKKIASCIQQNDIVPESSLATLFRDAKNPYITHDAYGAYYSFIFEYTEIDGDKVSYRSLPFTSREECEVLSESIDTLNNDSYYEYVSPSCTPQETGVISNTTDVTFYYLEATDTYYGVDSTFTYTTDTECIDARTDLNGRTRPKYKIIGTTCLKTTN